MYDHDGGMKEAIWLQWLLDDLGIDQDLLKINCDSMSAIYLAKNQVFHAKMKHIDVRFHFVRKILDTGDIELKKIHTKEIFVDMLTKVNPRVKFEHCKKLLHSYLSSVELAWMNYERLDHLGRGYIGNHIGAAWLNRHGNSSCSAQI